MVTSMCQSLIEFLKLLEKAIPPPVNCHHAITYAQYGSDSEGWQDRLALQLNREGQFHCIFLHEADFKKIPATLVAEIVASPIPSDIQLGVGLGQYLK